MSNVDITQLAIDRQESSPQLAVRRNLVSRYLIPGIILAGFLTLIAWAAWDLIVPPRDVRVVPVIADQTASRIEGTPLFNAAGWIEPRPTAIRVAALAPGVVERLLVVEDQSIKKGEPIAELIKEDAQLTFKGAEADRKLAEAELAKANASLAAAETKLKQPVHLQAILAEAQAKLAKVLTMLKNLGFETERAMAKLDLAKRNHQRNTEAESSVSQRELDESQTALETANALVQELKERELSLGVEKTALEAQTVALKKQLELLADEIQARDEGKALVAAAQARLDQKIVVEEEAKLRLSRMTIRAPVNGRVYQLIGLPGARIGEGIMTAMKSHDGSSVITMYQPRSLQIRVDVRFEDIPKVTLNQNVEIKNPALENAIFGKVLFISSEADIQKNTLQVKVSIDSPPDFFKPETLVDVTFLASALNPQLNKTQETVFVPRQFIHSTESGDFIWVADQSDGIARKTPVTLGQANGPLVRVLTGLKHDSRIITTAIERLKDGERIRIVGEDNTTE